MQMTQEQIDEIVRKHGLWLKDGKGYSRANLTGANLSWANLSGANLSGANMSRANLSGAKLSARTKIVSVSGVGSSRRLTNYCIDTDEVWCGCFKGTLAEFTSRVKETHKKNPQHLADSKAAIAFFKAAKKPLVGSCKYGLNKKGSPRFSPTCGGSLFGLSNVIGMGLRLGRVLQTF